MSQLELLNNRTRQYTSHPGNSPRAKIISLYSSTSDIQRKQKQAEAMDLSQTKLLTSTTATVRKDTGLGDRDRQLASDQHHQMTSTSPTNTHSSSTSTSTCTTRSASVSHSHSHSTASTSPSSPHAHSHSQPVPVTPPRRASRSRSRYTDLGRRVPLHRRGKSRTYECLEDLLQEAGYKETRIFTPETDRLVDRRMDDSVDDQENEEGKASTAGTLNGVKAGVVGALVGYLTSTFATGRPMSRRIETTADHQEGRGTSEEEEDRGCDAHRLSPSSAGTMQSKARSSLDNAEPTVRPSQARMMLRDEYQFSTTSLPLPLPASSSTASLIYNPPSHRHTNLQSYKLPHHHHRSSYDSGISHQTGSSGSSRTAGNLATSIQGQTEMQTQAWPHPHPLSRCTAETETERASRAGAYLRHMISVPNMQTTKTAAKRGFLPRTVSNLVPPSSTSSPQHLAPPLTSPSLTSLPKTWLESVARTLLFGGSASASTSTTSLNTVAVTCGSGRYCGTAGVRGAEGRRRRLALEQAWSGVSTPTLPELFVKVERGRAGKSEGEVNKANVLCRSEPASRANSRVRERRAKVCGGGKESGKPGQVVREKKKGKKKKRLSSCVPVLASTEVEAEGDGEVVGNRDVWRPLLGGVVENGGVSMKLQGAEETEEDDEEEEEEELDLAQMLVPPKRQNSIRSLRKHLAHTHTVQHTRHRHGRLQGDAGGGGGASTAAKSLSVFRAAVAGSGQKTDRLKGRERWEDGLTRVRTGRDVREGDEEGVWYGSGEEEDDGDEDWNRRRWTSINESPSVSSMSVYRRRGFDPGRSQFFRRGDNFGDELRTR